ncbi:BTAD domain-containing putative transcriptional regulator [Streptomyces sp. S.PB5]|uniref:AfsR/SARP family transcriptional regulator n=1 Tax=Streptomyces sp. S.PB5 TaxID=3020844 RepID=UPI0025B1802F|nr:BTAD domain-containing putative transcriptional regulator [Streptomyces sp. S.PB5]MDN3027033.1 BTAD domain-containing putative transcriptional regulator [Streptomyces sp. S.PB5]
MDIEVLGPVRVRDTERGAITLGGPRQRTLLALLACESGRAVPVHRIIDALWDERLPKDPRSSLHTQVSALRRILGPGVLVREGDAYRLELEAHHIDVHAFTDGAAAARRATDEGRHEEAVAAFLRALGCWRGAPLGGASGAWAAGERSRLTTVRLDVQEDLLDAATLLGRDVVPVNELAAVVERHPLRERLRGHLMLALTRQGRQSDALVCYQEGRRILVEELGIEPGPALREIHRQVLGGRGDGSRLGHQSQGSKGRPPAFVEPSAHVSCPAASPTPRQLPPDTPDFTGRTAELRYLRDLRDPVLTITGAPGMGKTTLAVHAAHLLRHRFPDGQLFAELHGTQGQSRKPDEVLGRFLLALGASEHSLPRRTGERVDLYRTLLADRRVLVVLDDAADERQVRPLLPSGPRCVCLVTSRSQLAALEGARRLDLPELVDADSVQLLERVAGSARVEAERGRALEIVRLCGHLPLAVRIAGARLSSRPDLTLLRLAGRLREEHRRLNELAIGDLEVRGSLVLSYAGISPLAQKGLRRIGWLGVPDFPAWLVAVLLERDAEDGEDVVDELVRAQLVQVAGMDGTGIVRYRLHDLTRLFAHERAVAEDEAHVLHAAAGRAGGWWLALIEEASRGTPVRLLRPRPSARGPATVIDGEVRVAVLAAPDAWFEAEQSALVRMVERATEVGLGQLATDLATALCASSFAVHNRFHSWWHTHSVALEAARRDGDHAAEALLLAGLGWLRSEQDRFDEAVDYYGQALRVYEDTRDTDGLVVTLLKLSGVLVEKGEFASALAALDRAHPLLPSHPDTGARAGARHSRGRILTEVGRLGQARDELAAAQRQYQAAGDEHGVGLVLRSLGITRRAAGDWEGAARDGARALATLRASGDRLMAAYAAQALAKTWIRQGREAKARELLREALDVCREMEDGFGQALVLRTWGEMELAADRPEDACGFLSRALEWWDSLGLPLWRARTLRDLAEAQWRLERWSEAAAAQDEARATFRRFGSREAGEPFTVPDPTSSPRGRCTEISSRPALPPAVPPPPTAEPQNLRSFP